MPELTILELNCPIFGPEGLYRSSPFEYEETAFGGQTVMCFGTISRAGRNFVVKNPFTAREKDSTPVELHPLLPGDRVTP